MKPKVINLHIDRLVLDGIGQLNSGQLALGLEKELHRLISTQGLHASLRQSASIQGIKAKPVSLGSRVREHRLGQQIANSVYRGMK